LAKIGFIGLGVMGGPMSKRLVERGHSLVVNDRDPEAVRRLTAAGATAAATARDVANAADTVFVSLPTPATVREVALGTDGIIRGSAVRTFVDLSTTGSIVEREVAAGLAVREIETVDAPVSGGAAGAGKGTLAVMVAGRPEAVAGVRTLLEVFGKVFVVGERAGQGQLMKLINNLLSQTAVAITAEALVAGVKGGLDADTMIAVINAGSGRNSATADKFPKWVLPRTFAFGFPIASVCKDASLAVDECQALGVPMWVGGAVRQLWQYAQAQGGGARDMTELVKYIEAWAGAEVRGKGTAKP
jgi:2-hydroxy-3-oxopropionate reductase